MTDTTSDPSTLRALADELMAALMPLHEMPHETMQVVYRTDTALREASASLEAKDQELAALTVSLHALNQVWAETCSRAEAAEVQVEAQDHQRDTLLHNLDAYLERNHALEAQLREAQATIARLEQER